jgi:hypothetical protein
MTNGRAGWSHNCDSWAGHTTVCELVYEAYEVAVRVEQMHSSTGYTDRMHHTHSHLTMRFTHHTAGKMGPNRALQCHLVPNARVFPHASQRAQQHASSRGTFC